MPFPSPFGELPAAPGGGALEDPTLEVGVSFGASDPDKAYLLKNNDAINPAVVELAFTHSTIKAKTFDHGTAESPSFALDPNPTLLATRPITFERGAGAPVYPAPPITETITATLADGSTVTQDMTVHAIVNLDVWEIITQDLTQPLLEYRFDTLRSGRIKSEGSLLGDNSTYFFDGTLYTGSSSHPWTQTASALYDGFTGYIEPGHQASMIYTRGGWSQDPSLLGRDADRTMVIAVTPLGAVTGTYIMAYGIAAVLLPWGSLGPSSGVLHYSTFGSGSAWSLESTQAGTSHSISGPAEDADVSASSTGNTILIAWTYNNTTSTSTVRWKQKGHAAGHSIYTLAGHTSHSISGDYARWLGYYANNSAQNLRYNYFGIVDGLMTGTTFDNMCAMAGF